MSFPCKLCGQYHDTSVCPPLQPRDVPDTPLPSPKEIYEVAGTGTINGLSFGEHEICRRLDRIIELLEPVRAEQEGTE